jgi:formate/nitrite transporter FocA (FNT family)
MLHRDRITLAVQLTRIYLKNIIGYIIFILLFLINKQNFFSENMTFENEFFEMAQALEENSDMINIQNKLSDAQVN